MITHHQLLTLYHSCTTVMLLLLHLLQKLSLVYAKKVQKAFVDSDSIESNRTEVLKAQGVEALVRSIQSSSQNVRENALLAIAAFSSDLRYSTVLHDTGAFPALVSALSDNSAVAQELALLSVRGLSRTQEGCFWFAAAGILEQLSSFMSNNAPEFLQSAASAVMDQILVAAIHDTQYFTAIATLLNHSNVMVQKTAVRAVAAYTSLNGSN